MDGILHTFSSLSRQTGPPPSTLRRQLEDVPPTRTVMREGNRAAAFEPRALPEPVRDLLDPYNLEALGLEVAAWRDPERPTEAERARLLDCAFLKLEALAQGGAAERVMKTRLLEWLRANVPALSESESALRVLFNRKLARWRAAGGKSTAVRDGRRAANKARRRQPLPKEDTDRLVAVAVFKYDGCLTRAWRLEWPNLSEATRQRYPKRRDVPKRVREALAREVRRQRELNVRPRHAKLNGGHNEQDWSGVAAGDWFSADDCTLPVYYYVEDGQGWYTLTRGQFIPMIDARSKKILHFVLISAKSYTAADIRSLNTKTCEKYHLPRKGWQFERGLWKRADMLGGGEKRGEWDDAGETFAERLGLRILHCLPGNSRGKVVENILGLFQNYLTDVPGYVGRDEMGEKFERVQQAKLLVQRSPETRVHPAEAGFLSEAQYMAALQESVEEYNDTEQDSIVMIGRMSPNQAWEQLQGASGDPTVTRLPGALRHLLAGHREEVVVTVDGVFLKNGRRYDGAAAASREGKKMASWFDPDCPEILTLTDLDNEHPFWLEHRPKTPAMVGWETAPEKMRQATRLVNEHSGEHRRRHAELKALVNVPFRTVVLSAEDKARAEAIQAAQAAGIAATRKGGQAAAARKAQAAADREAAERYLKAFDEWKAEVRIYTEEDLARARNEREFRAAEKRFHAEFEAKERRDHAYAPEGSRAYKEQLARRQQQVEALLRDGWQERHGSKPRESLMPSPERLAEMEAWERENAWKWRT